MKGVRLIDAKALMKDIEEARKLMVRIAGEGAIDYDKIEFALNAVMAAPTIEAEPVQHGRWIDAGDFALCSVCQSTYMKEFESYYGKATRFWVKTSYCPHCGAKMDAREEVTLE